MGHLTAYGKPVDCEGFMLGAHLSWSFVGLWDAQWGKEVHGGTSSLNMGGGLRGCMSALVGIPGSTVGPALGASVLAGASGQCSGT